MPITPDDKDWTWVIEERCPECGFDASSTVCTDVAGMLRAAIQDWFDLLTTRRDARERPRPDVWSPLEYGCHVRDVFRLYDYRLGLMLDTDDPLYPNWDQNVTAVDDKYAEQDPVVVAQELDEAATSIAAHFEAVEGEQWQRRGRRSDGASFTVDTFARYFLHDVVHHLHDVGG